MKADITKIRNDIKRAAIKKKTPDDEHYTCISSERVGHVAKRFKVSGRDIEITALEQNIVPDRYVRNMKTFSSKEQIALLTSRVCVVGLGGLGGVLVEILARIGIGSLNLIDGDMFEEDGRHARRQTDAPVRCRSPRSWDRTGVHADPVVGQAQEVGHLGTLEAPACRDWVYTPLGISSDELTPAVVDFAVQVRPLVGDL